MSAEVTPEQMAEWRRSAEEHNAVLATKGTYSYMACRILALLDEVERLQLAGECTADDRDHYIERANKAEADLRVLREGVEVLVGECASSDCIHLNDMWGRLRALVSDGPSA